MIETNQRLHETLIEILNFVKEICETNDLTYFLVYGTALGAKRHNGFIPWDDDIDIALPRDDYNKLIAIIQKNNSSKYSIQNEENEPKYFLTFAKVRKNNTLFIENILEVEYENNGIYIDIFPLDYVAKPTSVTFKLRRAAFDYIKHILEFTSCKTLYKEKYGIVRFLIESIISIPTFFLSNRSLLSFANWLVSSSEEATYIGQYDQSGKAAIMPSSYYFPPRLARFEGEIYNVPAKIEEYLECSYGKDYMSLPPVEKRTTHQPVKLEF